MEYRHKARKLMEILQTTVIMTEKEVGVEISHISFLQKTLKNLKSAVSHLRIARKNTVICGMTSRRSERSVSPLRDTVNTSHKDMSFNRQMNSSKFLKSGKKFLVKIFF